MSRNVIISIIATMCGLPFEYVRAFIGCLPFECIEYILDYTTAKHNNNKCFGYMTLKTAALNAFLRYNVFDTSGLYDMILLDNNYCLEYAKTLAYSLLKKLYEKTYNNVIKDMLFSLKHDIVKLEYGIKLEIKNNIESKQDINKQTVSDAYDLVVACYNALLYWIPIIVYKFGVSDIEYMFMKREYTKQVYIDGGQKPQKKWVKTNIAKECYKEMRRVISSNKAIFNHNKFTYIDDIINDIPCYHRLQYKYDTMDTTTYNKYLAFMEKLTNTQQKVLKARLQGIGGYNVIATYLGISENTCKSALREIRKKSITYGFDVAMYETIQTKGNDENSYTIQELMQTNY